MPESADAKVDVQQRRRIRYARAVAVLLEDRESGGAAAGFDEALSNGLAAIVADEWPGSERRSRGVKSAAELLQVVRQGARDLGGDRYEIPARDVVGPTTIDVGALERAISATQAVRHARSADSDEDEVLKDEAVEALEALDTHPALRWLLYVRADRLDQVAERNDWDARAQASTYWDRLSDDEKERRATEEYVEDQLPADPEERSSMPDPEPCDVCGNEAFLPDGWDVFGGTHEGGVCLACAYVKSEAIAYQDAVMEKIEYEMGKND